MYCERCGQKKIERTASDRLKINIVAHVQNEVTRKHMLELVRQVNIDAFDRGIVFAKKRGY